MSVSTSLTQKHIKTPRLLLRAAQPGDETGLFAAFSDPEVMRYWSTLPHPAVSETKTWITKMITSPQNGTTDFIIHYVPTDTAIGKIGIWQDSEIGFMIAREYWRKGIVSEALGAVLPYYFEELGYENITADIDPRNEGSENILTKFGFVVVGRREKTWEIGGVWVDSLDLELKKEKWKKTQQKS
jgi:ribosomal-protein-alanine N-acetyltransferase